MPFTSTAVNLFNLRAMPIFDLTANLGPVAYSESGLLSTHKRAHV